MQSLTRKMIVVMLFHVVAVLQLEMYLGRQLVGGVRKGGWPRSGGLWGPGAFRAIQLGHSKRAGVIDCDALKDNNSEPVCQVILT